MELRIKLRRAIASFRGVAPPFYRLYPARLPNFIVDGRFAISHAYKFSYTRISKAANSTIIASLYGAETNCAEITSDALVTAKNCHYVTPSQLSAAELEQFKLLYFKFSFVRNPYSRILSAYLDKIPMSRKNKKREIVRAALGSPPDTEISFSGFLDYLEFENGIDVDGHWARQTDLLVMPINAFDFVGKMEQLETDLPDVLDRIFGSRNKILNWVPHAMQASKKVDTLDEKTKSRIARLYEADFDNFRYPTKL